MYCTCAHIQYHTVYEKALTAKQPCTAVCRPEVIVQSYKVSDIAVMFGASFYSRCINKFLYVYIQLELFSVD